MVILQPLCVNEVVRREILWIRRYPIHCENVVASGRTGWTTNFEYVRFPPDPSSEPTGVRSNIDSGGDEAT